MVDNKFVELLTLMQLQNVYINQAIRYIFLLYTDINLAGNTTFQEFTLHFHTFVLNHANSEGFSKAIETQQVDSYILLDKLLSTHVLAAAEHLETAIGHFEFIERFNQLKTNPHLLLLDHNISLIEENELKIIETLESILKNSCEIHLRN